jgi:hypothetical protein
VFRPTDPGIQEIVRFRCTEASIQLSVICLKPHVLVFKWVFDVHIHKTPYSGECTMFRPIGPSGCTVGEGLMFILILTRTSIQLSVKCSEPQVPMFK